MAKRIEIGPTRVAAVIADELPTKGWSFHTRGYVIYTGRGKRAGIKRGTRAHRATVERALGRKLEPGETIHHMDFDKRNNAPENLLICPPCLNPSPATQRRCPFTGQFLSAGQWERRFGSF